MPAATGFGFKAGGNVNPARFCKLDTTADHTVIEATAGSQIIGVSQKGTRNAPYSSLDDGYCAIAGETFRLFTTTEVCPIELGGTVTAGDRLKATTGGKAITASTGDYFGAIALESGVSGEFIQVEVLQGTL